MCVRNFRALSPPHSQARTSHQEDEKKAGGGGGGGSSRQAKSLGAITQRLKRIIAESSSDEFDTNELTAQLGVPKRRVYDIIAVFVAVKWFERVGTNKVRWW